MEHFIRIDDYPSGDRALFLSRFTKEPSHHLLQLDSVLSIFRAYETPYILGVTPFLIRDYAQWWYLKEMSLGKSGQTCLHGFDHGWSRDWSTIVDTWKDGGEFAGKTEADIRAMFQTCSDQNLIGRLPNFNTEHFIAPFNAFNQALLNVLDEMGFKYVHTCSKEWEQFNQGSLDYGKLTPVISEWDKTYRDIDIVTPQFEQHDSQITLHWQYDCFRPNYREWYATLCQKFNRRYGVGKLE